MMLKNHEHAHISRKWIFLRFIGVVFFIVSLYYIVYSAAGSLFPFQPAYVRSEPPPIVANGLFFTLFDIAWRVIPLSCLAIGLVCIGLSARNTNIAYWSLQIALWLIGISLWTRLNGFLSPFSKNPTWFVMTIVCSLALLLFYKPVKRSLTSLLSQ